MVAGTRRIGLLAAWFLTVNGAPSPQSLNSDVTILTHNDLYGNVTSRTAATIVLGTRQAYQDAQDACRALSERLWDPPRSVDLDFLRYLDPLGPNHQKGQFWIQGQRGSQCSTIDSQGERGFASCDRKLSVLCSQSAPLTSPSNYTNKPQWQTSVKTGNATITGFRDRLAFRFLGIKFAPKPVRYDYARYQAPAGNVSALNYGPGCYQASCTTNGTDCSEDCLHLNIWTPTLPAKTKSNGKKAVMFWIYGGGYVSGFGSDPTFDGGNLASRGDVVVVTLNYRLSTLGFLALDNTTLKGNYWLSDQIAALDWVRNEIAAFGGDKDKITIFGQSAGASSVRALLASPRAKGKFSRAILQSCPGGGQGYVSTFSQWISIADATTKSSEILTQINCSQGDASQQVACLRAVDPLALVRAPTTVSYPVVDGTYLTSSRLQLDNKTSDSSNVTVMSGAMRDDGGPFTSFPSPNATALSALTNQGYNATAILNSQLFPIPQGPNNTLNLFNLTSRLTTNAAFRCLTQATTYAASLNHVYPKVYAYEIDRSFQIIEYSPNPPTCEAPITAANPFGDPNQNYYKCHSGELYYIFGTATLRGRQLRDKNDVPFNQYLLDTWAAFARTKDPNPSLDFLESRGFTNTSATVRRTTKWRPVDASNPRLRALDVVPTNLAFREVPQCAVLGLPLDYLSK